MKQKISLFFLGGLVSVMALFAFVPSVTPAYAQQSDCTTDCVQSGLTDIQDAFPNKTQKTLPELVKLVINWALYLSAIVAVIFIIIGGFLYITSAGDPGRASKGRTTLVNALIGLTIIVLSFLIVQILYDFLTT